MTTTNDELKRLIEGIPEATRDTMREEMEEIANMAAERAISGHVEACRIQRREDEREAEEERSKVIQIRKKSALWWVKMAGAISVLLASGAGFRQIFDFILRAF